MHVLFYKGIYVECTIQKPTDLAELHFEMVRVAADVKQRFLKSLDEAPFDVVLWNGRKLHRKRKVKRIFEF